jgi:hypothetical protein
MKLRYHHDGGNDHYHDEDDHDRYYSNEEGKALLKQQEIEEAHQGPTHKCPYCHEAYPVYVHDENCQAVYQHIRTAHPEKWARVGPKDVWAVKI